MPRFAAYAWLLLAAHAFGQPAAEATLELVDCRIDAGPGYPGIDARCGTFSRPLDPTDPGGDRIDLNVAVVPALSLEPQPDPFVPIAGGPGQSTVLFYAGWFHAFERVRQERDILLIDQRGTGDSAPLNCEIDDDFVAWEYSAEQTLHLTEECLARLPHDPRYFTTSVAVTDLEALRQALGYSALNLYGISYGSRVAQHFARRYPDSTRTLVIDGVVPPQLPLGPDIAIESQRALDAVFDRCAEEPACSARFPTLREDFAAVRGVLADGPLAVQLQHPVTARLETIEFGDTELAVAIRLLLYHQRTVALLPLLIDEAANGNYSSLAAQFMVIASSLEESISIGMHNAVMCTEDAPYVNRESVDRTALDASYIGPVLLDAILTMCSVWPSGVLDDGLREPLRTDKPVLLLSGGADPITPPEYAELAASDLSNKHVLVGEHQGHGLAAVGCMPRLIDEFVETLQLERDAADCLESSFAMPFFVEFSGPTP